MYRQIMVPVDLAHVDRLEKALTTSADLAKCYNIPVCYVGVTAATPGPIAHTPAEYARKLEQFAGTQASIQGVEATARTYTSHDPAVDLDKTLIDAIKETGSDLVVMASHLPGLADHVFASKSGYLAAHAPVSVLLIR